MTLLVGIFVIAILSCHASLAQLPTADLTRIEPHVGSQGQTLEVSLVGQNLDDLTELRFTHPGISAKPVLRPADEFFPSPSIDGSRFNVTIAEDVRPGIYEVRGVAFHGLSTARPFVVTRADSKEVAESGNNGTRENAMPVEVNSIVNGTVASRGVDWFKFTAKANQTVLLEVCAERIDSRLDSQLILYDSSGREVDRNRDAYGRDSLLRVRPDKDGEFYVALSDILYRGGADYFYRFRIHDGPHVDFVFPPAGQPGSTRRYTLYGSNLPGPSREVELSLPSEVTAPRGHFPGRPRQGVFPGFDYQFEDANSIRIGLATAPVVIEVADQSQQPVSVPCEITGRFDEPNDEDTYRFATEAGGTYCIEAIADRMGFDVDPYLVIHQIKIDEAGNESLIQVVENDDLPSFFSIDGKDSIDADTNDAFVTFQSEHNDHYQVTIVNQFGDGGAGKLYRLAIRQPTPDFQLIATAERPLATNRTGYSVTPHLRRGAKWGIRIVCPRQDGFEGDVVVTAEDLPSGVSARPLTLHGKTDQGILVVAAEPEAESWSGDIRIVGRAKVGEAELIREARFACLVWGHVFADSIRVRSRLTERVPLSINAHEHAPVAIGPVENKPWTVELGQKLEIPIKISDIGTRVGNLTIEPRGLFGMLRNPPTVNVAEKDSQGTLTISFAPNGNFQAAPGHYQFALHGTGVAKYQQNLRASALAAKEQQRIEKLAADVAASADSAKDVVDQARSQLQSVQQKAAGLSAGDAKVVAQAELESAMIKLREAEQAAEQAAVRLKTAEKAKSEISKIAKSASDKAVEKNTNFAAWSDLITVVVEEPKKK